MILGSANRPGNLNKALRRARSKRDSILAKLQRHREIVKRLEKEEREAAADLEHANMAYRDYIREQDDLRRAQYCNDEEDTHAEEIADAKAGHP